MKSTKNLTLLLAIIALSSSVLFAKLPTPTISTKYSDSEIATLIQNYKSTPDRDVKVDGALLKKFQADFPKAKFVEWETNDEVYEADFEIGTIFNTHDIEAYYDKNGELLMYEAEISVSDLPANVKETAQKQHPNYRFDDDIEKIVKGKQTYYKIEMEHRDNEVTIYIGSDGKVIR